MTSVTTMPFHTQEYQYKKDFFNLMTVSIIAIGDELLIGQVTDTNSGEIARMINPFGLKLKDIQIVGDDASQILRAIDRAFESSDIVLTTGGLGPTKDDITKSVLCQYFGGELKEDPSVLANVKTVVEKRGIKLNSLTATQAIVPTSCKIIQNEVGTAPIMWFEKDNKILVSMPGVPFEMREMFKKSVLPLLYQRHQSNLNIEHRTTIIIDRTESDVAMTLDKWEENLPSFIHLAYLPQPGLIRLRLDGIHNDKNILDEELNRLQNELATIFSDNLLFKEDKNVEEILLYYLEKNNLSVSTAESCTGGNIAHRITSIPGSSSYFMGGVVAYSNDVKHNILKVSNDTLFQYGAVSIPVVEQMADGVCKAIKTDCAIATSGIAGPGGGTPEKPVGTVCIAVKTTKGIISETHKFPGNRSRVIDRASTVAMIMLIKELKKNQSFYNEPS